MSQEILTIPLKLKNIIEGYFLEENQTGCSDTTVYHLKHQEKPSLYLKILPLYSSEKLKDEYYKLNWLKNYLPVPDVIYFSSDDDNEYLLMSEIKGQDFSKYITTINDIEYAIKILAQSLKFIHSIDISECRFVQTLKIKLAKAFYNAKNGYVDETDFDKQHIGKSALQLFSELENKIPSNEDLVFTHGDFCLPNIIVNDNRINGFIDLGRSGIADRYQDLALVIRSIDYNFNKNYSEIFFKYYGINNIDYSKIEFYKLLDEFF